MKNKFLIRVLVSLIIFAIILPIIYIKGIIFAILIFTIILLMANEFFSLVCKNKIFKCICIFALIIMLCVNFNFATYQYDSLYLDSLSLIVLFLIMMALPIFIKDIKITNSLISLSFIIFLSLLAQVIFILLYLNSWLAIYLLIMVMIVDSLAMLGGMKFGKHPLITRVSPTKTIEGSVIGYFGGVIISILFLSFVNLEPLNFNIFSIIIISLIIPAVAQIGDLVFSVIKRNYNVKDFSNLLPQHGGILDRSDSFIFSILTLYVLLTIFFNIGS